MNFSQSDWIKFTGYLVSLIASIFLCSFEIVAVDKIEITQPFAENLGYMQGGKPFDCPIIEESGQTLTIDSLNGNVVVIMLFTTWCPSCPVALQRLATLAENLRRRGVGNVKIIALNIGNESTDALKTHYKTHGVQSLEVYRSVPPQAVGDIQGVPACLVFRTDGSPYWGYLGVADYASEKFLKFIEDLAKR
ncbi:MAG: TlpA family protein disulfide reductase [Holosporaceae bacterium]|jgi:thiol-disulfide isomerase/thioredoxin|nr:TlpA family protein disulfide reductase [Holosporaceae bacterium]